MTRVGPGASRSGRADIGAVSLGTHDGRIIYDSEAGNAAAVSVMNADGSSPTQLIGEMTGSAFVSNAVASADGRHIFYASDLTGARHIWRLNSDGSNPVQLTNGDAEEDQPSPAPDGRWVAYARIDSDRPTLWRTPTDGGQPIRLTHEYSKSPAVSPDGS